MIGQNSFRADFIFPNRVFPSRAVLSVLESRVSKRILDGESNLVCNLAKETDISLTEGIVSEPAENQEANARFRLIKGKQQTDFKPSAPRSERLGIEPRGEGLWSVRGFMVRNAVPEAIPRSNKPTLRGRTFASGKSRRKVAAACFPHPGATSRVVALHHAPDALRDGTQEIAELQI